PGASGGHGFESRPRHSPNRGNPTEGSSPGGRSSCWGFHVEGFPGLPPAAIQGGTLFGLSGEKLRRVGLVLLIVGLVMFLGSMLPAFLAIGQVASDPFRPGGFGLIAGSFFLSF